MGIDRPNARVQTVTMRFDGSLKMKEYVIELDDMKTRLAAWWLDEHRRMRNAL